MTNIKKSILWRVATCFAAVAVFALWVAYSMLKIQVVEGEKWLSQSDSMAIIRQDITPARGNIYSDNGSLLATSMPIYEVHFDPVVVNKDSFRTYVGELAAKMHQMFPEYSASYYKKYFVSGKNSGSRYLLIRRRVNYNQLKEMKSWPIFRMGKYRGGLISELTTKRIRPAGQLAFRTIGYRTEDNPGVGLERAYDEDLGGVKGQRLAQRISGGYRPINDDNLIEPQNGRDVHTTINIDFQEVAHAALKRALEKHNADHGCVLVMEVKTGQIKAIVNLKNYGEGKIRESYNYAIGESYEPGSVFKVFSAMAALEDGIIQSGDSLDLYGGVRMYYGKPMKDSDHGKYKKVDFKTAFARSSNVAFSSVIFDNYKKDPADYIAYLKKLELHKKVGIEILGEPEPFLNQPSSSSWSNLTLPWLAIGYENQHTPLQVLTAYNAVINKGQMVAPYMVSKVTDAGLIVKETPYITKKSRVCSEQTSDTILAFTKETVESGTARNIRSSVVSLAGKTGTAQIASTAGYQAQRQYNASFVGHFPAEEPEYSVMVMVNRPSAGIFYASYVAGPVFKELAENIYTISVKKGLDADTSILPTLMAGYTEDIQQLNSSLAMPQINEVSSPVIKLRAEDNSSDDVPMGTGEMPALIGMGARDALYMLELEGVKVKMNGYGTVKKQSPKAGVKLIKGSTVYLHLDI